MQFRLRCFNLNENADSMHLCTQRKFIQRPLPQNRTATLDKEQRQLEFIGLSGRNKFSNFSCFIRHTTCLLSSCTPQHLSAMQSARIRSIVETVENAGASTARQVMQFSRRWRARPSSRAQPFSATLCTSATTTMMILYPDAYDEAGGQEIIKTNSPTSRFLHRVF